MFFGGLSLRLGAYVVVGALVLGALWYVHHLKSAWLDEHDRALRATENAQAQAVALRRMTEHQARQAAAVATRDRENRALARRLAEYRRAHDETKRTDPVYASWGATPHPPVVGVLLDDVPTAAGAGGGVPGTDGSLSRTDSDP
ncbi:MAG: hypothetical protein AB7K73_16040 [Gammaproteobacteria bacterium]